jgi:hypothetical protein
MKAGRYQGDPDHQVGQPLDRLNVLVVPFDLAPGLGRSDILGPAFLALGGIRLSG